MAYDQGSLWRVPLDKIAAALLLVLTAAMSLAADAPGSTAPAAAASTKTSAPSPSPETAPPPFSGPTVKSAAVLENGIEVGSASAYGSRIRVVVGMSADSKVDFQKVVPYIDGHAFKGIYPALINPEKGELEYVLPPKVEAKELWRPILRNPPLSGERRVAISVGPEEGPRELPPADYRNRPGIKINLVSGFWWALVAAIAIVGAILCWLGAKSGILRDGTPPPKDATKLPPYSLAKTQAAVWFFLVFAAFVFIYLMTGSFNDVMTAEALALIGIGSGTSFGAAVVESAKSDTEQQRRADLEVQIHNAKAQLVATSTDAALIKKIADLEQLVQPASRGLVKDLLTDVAGITLHRFQMLVWTLMLGVIFVFGVYDALAMPKFDPTLLALMGISAGVYLGFKIPEKQI